MTDRRTGKIWDRTTETEALSVANETEALAFFRQVLATAFTDLEVWPPPIDAFDEGDPRRLDTFPRIVSHTRDRDGIVVEFEFSSGRLHTVDYVGRPEVVLDYLNSIAGVQDLLCDTPTSVLAAAATGYRIGCLFQRAKLEFELGVEKHVSHSIRMNAGEKPASFRERYSWEMAAAGHPKARSRKVGKMKDKLAVEFDVDRRTIDRWCKEDRESK
ncbi:MAG: hypothetical protein O2931_16165 [Planctomycetota bacterium]|nr:hypothetical protein [Planctomycetota bacterium]MDA1180317.1 hypothetical protein [Planctomycetota bacterium]